jgi:hypothetical protein
MGERAASHSRPPPSPFSDLLLNLESSRLAHAVPYAEAALRVVDQGHAVHAQRRVPMPHHVVFRGGSCADGGIGLPPPSSARPFGPARFLPPPNSVLAAAAAAARGMGEAVASSR